jgi:hypothetical protein
MRLNLLHIEGKAIILSPEGYAFAEKAAKIAYDNTSNGRSDMPTEPIVVEDDLVLYPRNPVSQHITVRITYNDSYGIKGTYWGSKSTHESEFLTLELGWDPHPSIDVEYIKHSLIHELTHAVDPKVKKMVPGALTPGANSKIVDGKRAPHDWSPKGDNAYRRQPVEVEASMYQLAGLIVNTWKKGDSKQEMLNRVRSATPKELIHALPSGNMTQRKRIEIIWPNKAYRRKFLNTLLYIINKLPE